MRIAARKRKLASGSYAIANGKTPKLTLRLTKAGRKLVSAKRGGGSRALPVKVQLRDAGQPAPQKLNRRLRLRGGHS